MKRQKAANIIFMLFFLGFLFVGMTVTAVKPKETESIFENRTLASMPVLHRETFLDGSWFSQWETYFKDHAAGRDTLLKASAYIDLFVIKRPVVNDIVITDRNLLTFNGYETVDPVKIADESKASADNLSALKQHVQDNGGQFYYVAVSGQLAYNGHEYPDFLSSRVEYFSTALDCFKTDMAGRGVNLIDMGEIFDDMGHPENVYYATDHHLTFEGALLTYQAIMDRINADNSLCLPVLTAADITVREVANPFLGSRMRKLFSLISSEEKLKIAVPNQDIPFTRTNNGNPVAPEVYMLPDNTWDPVSYTVYMHGDIAETVIDTNRPELPDVLLVGDSYTNAVECLLYTSFNEMRSIDLRWYDKTSLADYIAAYQPDYVIVLRDYSVLLTLDGNNNWRGVKSAE
ncbi:MAG: hypothetical protein GXY05_12150 [Clostridiales bacterium]|nr:hypothetical protein [Clostridiales bacterium]